MTFTFISLSLGTVLALVCLDDNHQYQEAGSVSLPLLTFQALQNTLEL